MSDSIRAAFLLLQVDRPEEALRALARGESAEEPEGWYARALALIQLERHDEAAHAAERGLSVDPDDPRLLYALSHARLAKGDLAGAEQSILAALRSDSGDPTWLAHYALVVAHAGQLEKGERLIDRALAVDPGHSFVLRVNALLAAARHDDAGALDRAKQLLKTVPESASAHRLMAAVQASAGHIDGAATHLRRAVQINPADGEVADRARELKLHQHWLMWPLRPIHRFGPGPVWLSAVAIMFVLGTAGPFWLFTTFAAAWVLFCIYSWVIPPLTGWYMRRRLN